MITIKKIIFLYKSNSSIFILISFLYTKLINLFVKRKIVKFKKKHQILLSGKKITNDFFSANAYNFYYYLNKLKPDFDYLEIGSYEGNSAVFVANTFIKSKIYCVDNWVGTDEYVDHISFSKIEQNFNSNTFNYENIIKNKCLSDEFFQDNSKMFDAIYIDGYHHGAQVYKDCINSWKFLKNDGLLICDDYIWRFYSNLRDNPCYAINVFLSEIVGTYKLEKVSNSQIFIKKIID
jgi:predicted O-methyltransferase YrrM